MLSDFCKQDMRLIGFIEQTYFHAAVRKIRKNEKLILLKKKL